MGLRCGMQWFRAMSLPQLRSRRLSVLDAVDMKHDARHGELLTRVRRRCTTRDMLRLLPWEANEAITSGTLMSPPGIPDAASEFFMSDGAKREGRMDASMMEPSAREFVEHWFEIARAAKDTTVIAFNLAFDLWEREARRLIGAGAPPAPTPSASAADTWLDGWKRLMDSYAAAWQSAMRSDQPRAQTELTTRLMNEALRVWWPLWQVPSERRAARS